MAQGIEGAAGGSTSELDLIDLEQKLLRTLMENSPDQIYFKDAEHRFIMLNEATAKNLGTTVGTAIGKTDFDFFSEDRAKEYFSDEDTIIKSGKPVIGRVEKTGREGDRRWNFSTKIPIFDKEGKVVGIAGINRDITEYLRNTAKFRETL